MTIIKRKNKTGLLRLKIPKYGWTTVKAGEFLSYGGVTLDLDDFSFLGNHIKDFTTGSGKQLSKVQIPIPEIPEEEEQNVLFELKIKKNQKIDKNKWDYNVVNIVTGKSLNDSPLTFSQAKQFTKAMMEHAINSDEGEKECPLDNGVFGHTFNEFEQCSECSLYDVCETASEE